MLWPHTSISKPGYDELACQQALRGAMAEGREKEGELSCNYVSGIWTSVSKKSMRNAY